MIVSPVYSLGSFKRKCVRCSERTDERTYHRVDFNEGFSWGEVFRTRERVQHWKCHDKNCTDKDCRKDIEFRKKAVDTVVRALVQAHKEAGG